ncbi:LuxR C-terminal-related transcriptional regulator [Pseudarthrobacter oxydans]|uniref:LuxR C-terminal-related transcriptional regulator n=1 Tax=Pseudarthrobacter oxydans TaxID=1671 RepID=UPI00382741DC
MKIFISWSGEESKQVALLLKGWLKKLLQATEPWMSDEDIVPGTRWSQTIASELQASDFGIICVTQGNKDAQWINFEAGALSMAISETERKVVPLLIGFDNRGGLRQGPLSAFNALLFEREDMWKLVLTLNAELADSVDADDLGELFEILWPKLEERVESLREILDAAPAPAPPSQKEMLSEILSTVRQLQQAQVSQLNSMPLSSEHDFANSVRVFNAKVSVTDSGRALTERELAIASLAAEGASDREIANNLGVSVRTVEGHLYRIYSKLGVTSRRELRQAFHRYSEAIKDFSVPFQFDAEQQPLQGDE